MEFVVLSIRWGVVGNLGKAFQHVFSAENLQKCIDAKLVNLLDPFSIAFFLLKHYVHDSVIVEDINEISAYSMKKADYGQPEFARYWERNGGILVLSKSIGNWGDVKQKPKFNSIW